MMNYVKFIRGTQAAWEALQEKDKNTLYFIYESSLSTTGKLYLGDKLISGDSSSSDISDILSILQGEGISDGSLIVYDEEQGKWVNKPVVEALSAVGAFSGAEEGVDGVAGLVPQPTAEDKDKFLKGDGTWANATAYIEWEELPEVEEAP